MATSAIRIELAEIVQELHHVSRTTQDLSDLTAKLIRLLVIHNLRFQDLQRRVGNAAQPVEDQIDEA